MLATIKVTKEKELDSYKKEITSLIKDEIIKRMVYREGLYKYYVKHNLEIKKSKEVLNNSDTYQKILKG